MKKKLLVTAVIWLGVASFAFAQVEKGNWFLGGSSNLEFNSDKEKVKIDNTTNDRATYLDFDFRPQIGYFVIDKLPVGIAMDISLDKTKDEINDWEHTWNDFIIGPFVRYYITDLDGFMPFAEVSLGIGAGKETSNYGGGSDEDVREYNAFNFKVGIGGTYFITENVGFDLFIGYRRNQNTYKDEFGGDRASGDGDVTYSYGGLDFNLGFVISLGK